MELLFSRKTTKNATKALWALFVAFWTL